MAMQLSRPVMVALRGVAIPLDRYVCLGTNPFVSRGTASALRSFRASTACLTTPKHGLAGAIESLQHAFETGHVSAADMEETVVVQNDAAAHAQREGERLHNEKVVNQALVSRVFCVG